MKRIVLILLLVIALAGGYIWIRANRQVIADKNGNPIRYSFDEIEEDGITGLFVHNEDGTFSPAIRQMPNYAGKVTEPDPTRFLWYVETDKDMDDLIPTLSEKDELVIVYNIDGDLPDSFYLERYAMKGYTIGAHIMIAEDKTMYLSSEDALSGSQAKSVLSGMEENTDGIYTIAEISGSDVLPINNVDPSMNLLLGLEKEKLYRMRYYQGTKERETTFKADAKVFQSASYIPISTPYKRTSSGYFIVNLPQNLEDGYYYLSDIGFFRYKR